MYFSSIANRGGSSSRGRRPAAPTGSNNGHPWMNSQFPQPFQPQAEQFMQMCANDADYRQRILSTRVPGNAQPMAAIGYPGAQYPQNFQVPGQLMGSHPGGNMYSSEMQQPQFQQHQFQGQPFYRQQPGPYMQQQVVYPQQAYPQYQVADPSMVSMENSGPGIHFPLSAYTPLAEQPSTLALKAPGGGIVVINYIASPEFLMRSDIARQQNSNQLAIQDSSNMMELHSGTGRQLDGNAYYDIMGYVNMMVQQKQQPTCHEGMRPQVQAVTDMNLGRMQGTNQVFQQSAQPVRPHGSICLPPTPEGSSSQEAKHTPQVGQRSPYHPITPPTSSGCPSRDGADTSMAGNPIQMQQTHGMQYPVQRSTPQMQQSPVQMQQSPVQMQQSPVQMQQHPLQMQQQTNENVTYTQSPRENDDQTFQTPRVSKRSRNHVKTTPSHKSRDRGRRTRQVMRRLIPGLNEDTMEYDSDALVIDESACMEAPKPENTSNGLLKIGSPYQGESQNTNVGGSKMQGTINEEISRKRNRRRNESSETSEEGSNASGSSNSRGSNETLPATCHRHCAGNASKRSQRDERSLGHNTDQQQTSQQDGLQHPTPKWVLPPEVVPNPTCSKPINQHAVNVSQGYATQASPIQSSRGDRCEGNITQTGQIQADLPQLQAAVMRVQTSTGPFQPINLQIENPSRGNVSQHSPVTYQQTEVPAQVTRTSNNTGRIIMPTTAGPSNREHGVSWLYGNIPKNGSKLKRFRKIKLPLINDQPSCSGNSTRQSQDPTNRSHSCTETTRQTRQKTNGKTNR